MGVIAKAATTDCWQCGHLWARLGGRFAWMNPDSIIGTGSSHSWLCFAGIEIFVLNWVFETLERQHCIEKKTLLNFPTLCWNNLESGSVNQDTWEASGACAMQGWLCIIHDARCIICLICLFLCDNNITLFAGAEMQNSLSWWDWNGILI